MAFTASSGYGQIENTPLAQPHYSNLIVASYYCKGLVPRITNTNILGDAPSKCHQTVYFARDGVAEWHDFEKNQQIRADEYDVSPGSLEICNAAYSAIKIDKMDEVRMCANYAAWEASMQRAVDRSKEKKLTTFVMSRIPLMAAAHNRGVAAGKISRNINLGAMGNPRILQPGELPQFFGQCNQVLAEACATEDGAAMYMVVPPAFETMMYSSPYSNMMVVGGGGKSIMLTGKLEKMIAGFEVYVSNYTPVVQDGSNQAHWIIFGRKDAVMFVENIIESRVASPSDSFHKEFQMLMVWGDGIIHNDGIAAAYVVLQQ